MSRSSARAYHTERVIVLGAGMSGLACARELQHRGFQVLVVEARGRVGGRLKGASINLASPHVNGGTQGKGKQSNREQFVDIGGALIHGVDDNPLSKLVEEMGIVTQPVQECLLFQNGWPIDPREDARISAVFNDCLEESFERCRDRPDDGSSFDDVFQNVCKERSVNSSNPVFLWHKANLEVSCGASFEDLGWKWNEDEPYGYDGDHVAVRPSWKAVVDGLAEGLDILYDAPVQRVNLVHPAPIPSTPAREPKPEPRSLAQSTVSGNGAKVVPSTPKRRRALSFDSAAPSGLTARKSRRLIHLDADARRSPRANLGKMVERYTEDHPPTRTKKHATVVKPDPLPLRPKRHPVVQITLQNGRILESDFVVCTLPLAILQSDMVTFDPPLPPPKQRAIHSLGAGLLNKCVLSFGYVFWQESDFLGLAGMDDEETPYLILNGHAYLGQPILLFLYGGSHAKRIEDWTDAEVITDCLRVLKKICGREIPRPVDYRMTRWGHEQYSKMAFTYIPPGVDGFEELKTMSEPVYDQNGVMPVLMFAGEHTSTFHPSTIHGAFLSGIREAYRLDLTLHPNANDSMTFSDSELYERTFHVSRRNLQPGSARTKQDSKKNNKIEQSSNAPNSRKQHRLRGAAGIMTLRKRPTPLKAMPHNGSVSSSTCPNSVRKSPRAAALTYTANIDGEPTIRTASDLLLVPCDSDLAQGTTSVGTDTLLRGLESYGNNYEYLLKVVAHPATNDKTTNMSLTQLKKKCKLLQPTLRSLKSVSTTTWKRWVAKIVYPQTAGGRNAVSALAPEVRAKSTPTHKERKRGQESIARQNSDLSRNIDGHDRYVKIRTRAGRWVRAPYVSVGSSTGRAKGSTIANHSRHEARASKASGECPITSARKKVKTRFGRALKRPEQYEP